MYFKYLRTLIIVFLVLFLQMNDLSAQNWADTQLNYSKKIQFRNIGPWRGGRACAVTGLPNEPNTYYFGSTGGGVWKTVNGGNSWKNISDGFFGGSIGAICVSHADQNVIYVGTGEHTLRGNVSSGNGIWKSTDEGLTWKHIGLDQSYHISRIRVHPDNPDIVYVGVLGNLYKDNDERGVFKSIDGGKTWQKVLYVSDKIGISDLIIDPNNPRRLYACSWRFRRTPYSFLSGGEGSGIWTSTDEGRTWSSLKNNKGLPAGIWGISGITVSPIKKGRIWAIIENADGGLFRSENYGKTWQKINSDRNLRQRAWYYSKIFADTKDKDIIYVLNVSYHKSVDGGKTFKRHRAKHGDNHDLWIDPSNSSRMIIGNDGGAQISNDAGSNWTTYMNQPTAQFYRVTTDNAFPFRIYAAQQDNSPIRIDHRSDGYSISNKNWESTAGGESGYLAPDPNNPNIVYGGSYGGLLTRYNHENHERRSVNVWPDNPLGYGAESMKYRFNWNFPIVYSSHDNNKLYTASNHIHVSINEGHSWTLLSPDLTRNDSSTLVSSGGPITKDNTAVEYYGTMQSFAESPVDENVLWAGSDDGLVHISKDGGAEWTNVTPTDLPEWSLINNIEADPLNAGSCYIACTLYKSGDFTPYIYFTNNFGETWKKRTNGIAKSDFVRVVKVDPKNTSIVFAGTENGLYMSTNAGERWSPFQQNLPIVPITDMVIHDPFLIIATQGRALWVLDDLSLIRQINKVKDHHKIILFKPKDTYRIKGGQAKNPKNQGLNHPNGAQIYFYIDSTIVKDSFQLIFSDDHGNIIREYSSYTKDKVDKLNVEAGANIFNWNLRYSNAKKFDGIILWWASLAGAKILPGQYHVLFIHANDTLTKSFKVILDPRIKSSYSQLEEKFNFIQKNNSIISVAHNTITKIRDLKIQLKTFHQKLDKSDAYLSIDTLINSIDSTISDIERQLYQTKLKSNQDPINFPIKLTNKLGHLTALISSGEYAPTKQNLAVQSFLIGKIVHELDRFNVVKNEQLLLLNKKIKELNIDAIHIKKVNN